MASLQDIAPIIKEITATGSEILNNKPGAREKLLNLSYSLAASVELPSEAISRIGWAEPARFALCRLATDMQLFERLAEKDSGVGVGELAKLSDSDPVLISRVLKHLVAMNIINETTEDCYTSTPLSRAFTEPKYRDGLVYTYDIAGPSFRSMPAYFKEISYRHPTNIMDGPFQYAHQTQAPFFQYLAQNPKYLKCFNNYMTGYRAGKQSWLNPGFYPFKDRIVKGYREGALLVDVGGGMGHDLSELKNKVADLPGELILQDQDEVITQLGSPVGFEATAHDFFTTQPVEGARAYYLHSVLHDWSDDDCRRILKPLVSVMKRGYSKILVNELLVPDTGATWSSTSMDWLMMALGAVRERTRSDWVALLESVGLKIIGIWTYEQGTESLIEAELA